MKQGKCITKDVVIFTYGFGRIKCFLDFGRGTKFNFTEAEYGYVLERKNMTLNIPKEDFERLFNVMEG